MITRKVSKYNKQENDNLKLNIFKENIQKKLQKLETGYPSVMDQCKIIRSIYLELNRNFELVSKSCSCAKLLMISRTKVIELQDSLNNIIRDDQMVRQDNTERQYYFMVKKTIYNFGIKYREYCIQQYQKIPGNIPLDIRKHIVSYIC
jgi:hypothetical protein|tara:strand:+ start:184 stop:627 length:444 start_codon:yes stop_codon:yes gene_type:complete